MPRKKENLKRHNILLSEGDLEWLQATYPGMGAAVIIRTLIERHRRDVERTVNERAPVDALSVAHQ